MTTPICDFIREYGRKNALKLHMPGHKGVNLIGAENLDITEIAGADSLYEANGIIAQSEANASGLFGCDTYYSTEGSSQCIRAMLYLACVWAQQRGKKPLIAAGRNAHKTFLSGAALLDFDIEWLYGKNSGSYLCCDITAEYLEQFFAQQTAKPTSVYITSPDYLGNVADIKALSAVCRKHGALLLVDNAHGAYLKFLPQSQHPVDLGADICCDSAHKTLPVLTGGAYLHLSADMSAQLAGMAKNALALFGSTSPSYVIMQSLDMANAYIADGYKENLEIFAAKVQQLKSALAQKGFALAGSEPLKITVSTKPYGYTGTDFAQLLADKNIVCEFADPDFVVFMLTPQISDRQLEQLYSVLADIPQKAAIIQQPPQYAIPQKVLSVRQAALAPSVKIKTAQANGKVLAAASVGCPPAVPVIVCGEMVDTTAVQCFEYYGIEECMVVK